MCRRFFYFCILFILERFLYDHSRVFWPYLRNVLYLFIAIEYDKTPTRFLSAWGPETKEQIKLAKY